MKIHKIIFWFVLMTLTNLIGGCSVKSDKILNQNDTDKMQVKSIAVLPISNVSTDNRGKDFFRLRLLEELYFKGYPKISLEEIDKVLNSSPDHVPNTSDDAVRKTVKNTFGADAIMNCSLSEERKQKVFYAPIKINAACELICTDSGTVIWKERSESIKRNFDFTHEGLDRKSHEEYEAVIDEVVSEIIKTLPDGPNFQ